MKVSRNRAMILSCWACLWAMTNAFWTSRIFQRSSTVALGMTVSWDKEHFSVAPMMGHTHRHYRFFFRLLSSRAHLYTEMVPASQIVSSYKRCRARLGCGVSKNTLSYNPYEIVEVLEKLKENPQLDYNNAGGDRWPTLHQLLETHGSHVILQLGGNNPEVLKAASSIAAAWGGYSAINLNCGCPSNAVGGRSGGCALMKSPTLVAECVRAMKEGVEDLVAIGILQETPDISVKHRLGIRQAATFDADKDRLLSDEEAFREVSSFVREVSSSGAVSHFQVHTRLGLLGDFEEEKDDNDSSQGLWVPGQKPQSNKDIKIDHKREQEKAKRRSRRATIQNREVPPLRPGVVPMLADAFPHLTFVANGGLENIDSVLSLVDSHPPNLVGGMVGRSVINHPCSFAGADQTIWKTPSSVKPTRREVLKAYIAYCQTEEFLLESSMGGTPSQRLLLMEDLRTKLIAVPFHLFVGEAGCDAFQRKILKLKDKTSLGMTSVSILKVASSFVPSSSLDKSIDDYRPWEEIPKFEVGLKRCSKFQKVVY